MIILDLDKYTVNVLYGWPEEGAPDKGLEGPAVFHVHSKSGKVCIGGFDFLPMPGNCGIVVSSRTYVNRLHRGKGLSYVLHEAKEQVARMLGYSCMICTVVDGNVPQIKGAQKVGWSFLEKFTNQRTANVCLIGVKKL